MGDWDILDWEEQKLAVNIPLLPAAYPDKHSLHQRSFATCIFWFSGLVADEGLAKISPRKFTLETAWYLKPDRLPVVDHCIEKP